MSDTLTTGKCLCGKVSYTLTGEPARMAQCHCKACQRATGTGHASLAFFSEDQVSIEGEAASYSVAADSGNTNTRHFCANCGGRLFSTNSARPGVMGVAIGSADKTDWFTPGAVLYCQQREAWDLTSTDLPNFDEMPPPPK